MTPVLRWGRGLLKLELLRPRGSVSDRASAPQGPARVTGNQALSIAGPGASLALSGAVTHEARTSARLPPAESPAIAIRWMPILKSPR